MPPLAKPAVSIVTPTYNRRHSLPRLWTSLSSQTCTNFQWIVIDDGSSDGTAGWVKGLADRRIIYRQQTNQGANAARNLGMTYITADYVIFLDSDDAFTKPTSLADMLDAISQAADDIGIVIFPVVDEYGQRRFDNLTQNRVVADYTQLVCDQVASGEFISILRRRISDLAPFPPYRRVESVRHLALASHAKTLFINKPMRVYYDHAGNKAADNATAVTATLAALPDLAQGTQDILTQHKTTLLAHCPNRYGRYCLSLGVYYLLDGKRKHAIAPFAAAIRYGVWRVRIASLILTALLPLPASVCRKLFILCWHIRQKWRKAWR